jgi:ABC-type lipoprotein export system ATPase subunit
MVNLLWLGDLLVFILDYYLGGGKTTFLNIIGTIDNSTSGSLSKFNKYLKEFWVMKLIRNQAMNFYLIFV